MLSTGTASRLSLDDEEPPAVFELSLDDAKGGEPTFDLSSNKADPSFDLSLNEEPRKKKVDWSDLLERFKDKSVDMEELLDQQDATFDTTELLKDKNEGDDFQSYCMKQVRQITKLSEDQLKVADLLGGDGRIDLGNLEGYQLWRILFERQHRRLLQVMKSCEERCKTMETEIGLLTAQLQEYQNEKVQEESPADQAWTQIIAHRLQVMSQELNLNEK